MKPDAFSTVVLSLKLLIFAFTVLFAARAAGGAEFMAGADFSHLGFFEDRGIVYQDAGQPQDAFGILKRHGLTCVRLRLFTSSAAQAQANPYNYTNNLDYTLPLAVHARNAGLQLLLNFHYSDTWADPGKQAKPAAWTNLATFDALEQQMYDYSSNTIATFKAAGALPEYVQVGNEIIGGMLWPDGRADTLLLLKWPLSGAGMSLMTASNLSPPILWQAVTNPIQTTGTVFSTTLPAKASHSRFYRLQSN